MVSYAFARRPRWIVMHAIVLIVVCLFAVAGFWQLHRLRERRADNAFVEERRMQTATSLDDARVHHRAELTGRYDVSSEVILRGRGLEGRPGDHLLTPLQLDDGGAILVDRGYVPSPETEAAPPEGDVTVTGYLLPSEGSGPFAGDGGPASDEVARVDVARIDGRVPYDLAPFYLLLQTQDPSHGEFPMPVPPLELGEGSHLSYAVQWFMFTVIALGAYAAILRREASKDGVPVASASR